MHHFERVVVPLWDVIADAQTFYQNQNDPKDVHFRLPKLATVRRLVGLMLGRYLRLYQQYEVIPFMQSILHALQQCVYPLY
jgi:hypothetical protein